MSRVPYQKSLGFGGVAGREDLVGVAGREEVGVDEEELETYDKGLVQKIVLIILKAVALTTRESR